MYPDCERQTPKHHVRLVLKTLFSAKIALVWMGLLPKWS